MLGLVHLLMGCSGFNNAWTTEGKLQKGSVVDADVTRTKNYKMKSDGSFGSTLVLGFYAVGLCLLKYTCSLKELDQLFVFPLFNLFFQ